MCNYLKHMSIHIRSVRAEPSLRHKAVRVVPKYIPITVYYCCVDTYSRSRREELAGDFAAASRHVAR